MSGFHSFGADAPDLLRIYSVHHERARSNAFRLCVRRAPCVVRSNRVCDCDYYCAEARTLELESCVLFHSNNIHTPSPPPHPPPDPLAACEDALPPEIPPVCLSKFALYSASVCAAVCAVVRPSGHAFRGAFRIALCKHSVASAYFVRVAAHLCGREGGWVCS